MDDRRDIAILSPDVSRRIAAGEVIERPASVVRELIDNGIDAGADEIDVRWSGGGAETIRVRDNGSGLTLQDLKLCWLPHATSKIRTIDDLTHARTLGFRGEALSSIAAVSSLSIHTTPRGEDRGHRLQVDLAEERTLEPAPPAPGTVVEVRRLFSNLPARRRFLSRPQAETTAIRNVVKDKAMPVPEVRFSFQADGGTLTVLPRQTLVERVSDVFGDVVPVQSLHEIHGSGEGFSITIVAAQPEIVRRDRRYVRTFVNGRRVWEYQLSQAVEYAYQDVQHGGLYPAAALFIDIEPELIDFNIHPAKREVRIRPSGEVHHRIVEVLRSFLRAYTVRTVQVDREFDAFRESDALRTSGESGFGNPTKELPGGRLSPAAPLFPGARPSTAAPSSPGARPFPETGRTGPFGYSKARNTSEHVVGERPSFEHQVRAVPGFADSAGAPDRSDATFAEEHDRAHAAATSPDLLYRGTIFETYIIVEWKNRAYMIDQHAAHERLLYDHYRSHRGTQRFLVPEEFSVTEDQDVALERHLDEFQAIGIEIERAAPMVWRLTGAPPEFREQTEMIIEMILELRGLQEELDRTFLAELACKAAVKGGDFVDDLTALDLARRTLSLETPRCPHGRPLWVELTRDRLERMIGRV